MSDRVARNAKTLGKTTNDPQFTNMGDTMPPDIIHSEASDRLLKIRDQIWQLQLEMNHSGYFSPKEREAHKTLSLLIQDSIERWRQLIEASEPKPF